MSDNHNIDSFPLLKPPKAAKPSTVGKSSVRQWLRLIVYTICLVGCAALLFLSQFLAKVDSDQWAIRDTRIEWLHPRGIQKEPLKAGLHFYYPRFESIHSFPKQIQVLELFHKYRAVQDEDTPLRRPSIRVMKSNQSFVDVDVQVFFHIQDPSEIVSRIGPGHRYVHRVYIIVKSQLQRSLTEMAMMDFKNPALLVLKAEEARDSSNESLDSEGMHVEQILITHVYMP